MDSSNKRDNGIKYFLAVMAIVAVLLMIIPIIVNKRKPQDTKPTLSEKLLEEYNNGIKNDSTLLGFMLNSTSDNFVMNSIKLHDKKIVKFDSDGPYFDFYITPHEVVKAHIFKEIINDTVKLIATKIDGNARDLYFNKYISYNYHHTVDTTYYYKGNKLIIVNHSKSWETDVSYWDIKFYLDHMKNVETQKKVIEDSLQNAYKQSVNNI